MLKNTVIYFLKLGLILLPTTVGCQKSTSSTSTNTDTKCPGNTSNCVTVSNPNPEVPSSSEETPEPPVASLVEVYYNFPQYLELVVSKSGTVYYTLDGSTPTTDSLVYTNPIHITENTVIKAITVINGMASEVVTYTYVITTQLPPAEPSLTAGYFNTTQYVTLASPVSGAKIYYTTNGDDPEMSDTLYSQPIEISSTTLLKWIVIKDSWEDSIVESANYVIDTVAPTPSTQEASEDTTSTGFRLKWNPASDNEDGELQYLVCSGDSPEDIDTVEKCLAAFREMPFTTNATSLLISGKDPDTTYYYNVVVKDAAGNTDIYPGLSSTTSSAPDLTAPTAGSLGSITALSADGYTLNWSAASDNATLTTNLEYFVCSTTDSGTNINSASKCLNATQEMAYTANATSYALTSRSSNTIYYYNVVVRDASNNTSIYNPPIFKILKSSLSFTVGDSVNENLSSTGGRLVSCSVTALPDGLTASVQGGECRLSGTPSSEHTSSSFTVSAIDQDGNTGSITFTLEISPLQEDLEWQAPASNTDAITRVAYGTWVSVGKADNGDAFMIWKGTTQIQYRHKKNGTWSSTQNFPGSFTSMQRPKISMNRHGDIALLYLVSSTMYVSLYIQGSWEHPSNTSDYIDQNVSSAVDSYQIKIADNRDVVASWTASNYSIVKGIERRDGSNTWSDIEAFHVATHTSLESLSMNASGTTLITFRLASATYTKVCAAVYNGSWSYANNVSECISYNTSGTASASRSSVSPNGKMALTYIHNYSNIYLHEYNGTTWIHPSGSADHLIQAHSGGSMGANLSLMIDDDSNIQALYQLNFDYPTQYPYQSTRQNNVWNHSTQHLFQAASINSEALYFQSDLSASKNGIAVISGYGGAGYSRIYAGVWTPESWPNFDSVTPNLMINWDGHDLSSAASQNGKAIIAWFEMVDWENQYVDLYLAEFD